MKTATFASFVSLIEEIGRAFVKTVRYGLRAVATMSWPALLVTAVALALAITIVPLALFLFIVFMVLKLLVAAVVLTARRRKPLPSPPAHGE
jgi:hypothetical protein